MTILKLLIHKDLHIENQEDEEGYVCFLYACNNDKTEQ